MSPKILVLAIPVVIGIAVLLVWLGRGCSKTAHIASVHITGESGNANPNESRLYFLSDAEPVILKINLDKVYTETELSTRWYFASHNTIVHETKEKLKSPGEAAIRLNRSAGDSELGDYRIEIALDGEVQVTTYFRVAESLPAPLSEQEQKEILHRIYNVEVPETEADVPILSQFATATSVFGLTQSPKDVADKFPPNAGVVYLTMLLSGAPEGTRIRVDWLFLGAVGKSEPRLIIPAELTTWGTRQLAFNLKPGTGDLPPGMYQAVVSVDDAEFSRVNFSVKAPPAPPASVEKTK